MPSKLYAQDEPLLGQLRDVLKNEYFNLGLVTQVVGTLQFDPEEAVNGFSIGAARLHLRGNLDGGFNYFLQTEFVSGNPLLDARLGYQFSETVGIHAGQFKAPFSAEFLIGAPNIDFINRSLVASTLVPGRQIGVALSGNNTEQTFTYSIGAFNGNGRSLAGNDNNSFLYAGRLAAYPGLSSGSLEVGINIAFSEDGTSPGSVNRLLFGGDFRFSQGPLLLSGEAIYGDIEPESSFAVAVNPFGYQATLGYMLEPNIHQVLLRLDGLNTDLVDDDDLHFLIFGYNYWPTQVFEIQVNYLLPLHDADIGNHGILVNFQVSF